jgi:hypothetical protein
MRRYWIAAAVAATAALWSVVPAAAAGNVLTTGSTSGPAVANNDVLTGNLKSGGSGATFTDTGGNGSVTCTTSSFQATVTGNPTAPGTATESLTNQGFSSCSITVFGASVSSISVDNLPYSASVTSPSSVSIGPGSNGPIQTTVNISSFFGSFQCIYRVHASSGKLSGTTGNSDNSLNFTNQQFDLFNGPSTCFASANFSASYAPVQDTTQSGHPAVFTN